MTRTPDYRPHVAARPLGGRALLLAGAAALALGFGNAALAQQGQAQQRPAQQGQQAQQQPGQAGQQGQMPQAQATQMQTVERSLRTAQEQLSRNQQQPNFGQARAAVEAGTNALQGVPQQAQRGEAYRTAQRELNEAQQALRQQQPNREQVAGSLREAADALVILIREVGGTAAAAGAAGGAQGAQIAVQQPSPQVTVQQAQPQVTVQQPSPDVTVQQPAPQVTVQQPAPQVTVQQPRPEVTVQQAQPQVTVQQPRPEVTVQQARPEVTVQQAQPQVRVQQAEPQVRVEREGQPQVTVQRQGEPQVQVQREGQPQVTVQREGQPQVQVERERQAQVQREREVRPGMTEQRTGATTAVPPPAQSGGAQPQVAVATPTAGVPLTTVQSLIGTDVYGANGREAGEVENLLIDNSGRVRAAVIEWGGFLGIGERRAMVPIERIRLGAAGNDRALLEMTREELEALPRYDRERVADYGRERGWGEGLRLYR
ncbi:PRC-barrel domain-containing protein [Falsiroseomonas sp.]|uniref:PRC-barrel domain-containing protein n=1 Tax=Falsiroseomonas sp. TaxID=2870721 RepID=UPI003566CBEF